MTYDPVNQWWLDIKSEKFEITDNQALILNGNVVIDFPDGILEAGKARVDRKNGTVEFKKDWIWWNSR